MNILNWFFKQKVEHTDLRLFQTNIDSSFKNRFLDLFSVGKVGSVAGITAHSPADMTVDIPAGFCAYDSAGERIKFNALYNVNCQVDKDGNATVPTAATTDRYIAVVAYFSRANTDPKVDATGQSFYYQSNESFRVEVIAGATAPAGTATKPAIPAGGVCVGDVKLTTGQTTISSGDITLDRVPQGGFSQDGSTLGGRTKEQFMYEYYDDVKKRGAVGDNLADDTAAIQAAINAVNTDGNKSYVFMPPGTYLVTSLTTYAGTKFAGPGVIKVGADNSYYQGGYNSAAMLGTAAPTAGTWRVGDRVFNTAPATGSASYWECVTAGTPGSWRAVYPDMHPLHATASGTPQLNDAIMLFAATQAFKLPINLTGSYCIAGVGANASTTFTIKKNGTTIGTMTFGAGATTATFSFTAEISFAAGDVLSVFCDRTDTTLANLALGLKGVLV